MSKNISKIACAALFFMSTSWLDATTLATNLSNPKSQIILLSGSLTVTQISESSAYMSWTMSGGSPYQVTVTDLTDSKQVTTFSTSGTNATIGELIGGHTYRFEASNSVDTLIVDLLVQS